MPEVETERRLAAILVADVVGYSRLIQIDEEGTRSIFRRLEKKLRTSARSGRLPLLSQLYTAGSCYAQLLIVQMGIDKTENQKISETMADFST